jgi:hypothetical protein
VRRRISLVVAAISGLTLGTLTGCADHTPPPPDAQVPPRHGAGVRGDEPQKPLPGPDLDDQVRTGQGQGELPPPPFNDVPLVVQETPEQRAFVDAYARVGRPRIVAFVNRTLDGQLLPSNDTTAGSNGASGQNRNEVTIETRDRRDDNAASDGYLQPGQYSASDARQIDYEAIETVLTDWLAAGGKVSIVSPVAARQRLSADQQRDVETGQARAMSTLGQTLDADVLVQVSARPTRQTRGGLEVRMVAEAINVQGGQSIGRAVVDMPPPLDKPRINRFTRFLARVLMDRMIGTWENMPPGTETPERDAARDVDGGNHATAPVPVPATDVPAVPAPSTAPSRNSSTPQPDQPTPPATPRSGPRIDNAPPPAGPAASEPSAEPSR